MIKTMGVEADESRRGSGVGISGIRLKLDFEQHHNWVI